MALTDKTTGLPPQTELTAMLDGKKEHAKLEYENALLKKELDAAVNGCQNVVTDFTAKQIEISNKMDARMKALATANVQLNANIRAVLSEAAKELQDVMTADINTHIQTNRHAVEAMAKETAGLLYTIQSKTQSVFDEYEQRRKEFFTLNRLHKIVFWLCCLSCVGSFVMLLLGR